MPLVEINDHPLYFEDSGGSGPPVIFSHGFLMDHSMFAAQVEALAGEFRCITWDERGFGDTPANGSFTYWDSADDALALLTYLGIERATLAGMSQGGFLSLRAALRAPERVAALVLIDTQAGCEAAEALPTYEGMNVEWTANGPAAVQDAIAHLILGPGIDPQPWFDKWAAAPRESFDLPFRCLVDREDITERLGEITCPVIIFHGDQDVSIPMAKAEVLQRDLSGCEALVVVKGAPHAANMSHPDQVNGPLAEFLRQARLTVENRLWLHVLRFAMSSSVSVRELRNTVSEVLRRVESGERITVTVDRRPVAELVPLRHRRSVPVEEALSIAARYSADAGLLREVGEVLSDTTDEV